MWHCPAATSCTAGKRKQRPVNQTSHQTLWGENTLFNVLIQHLTVSEFYPPASSQKAFLANHRKLFRMNIWHHLKERFICLLEKVLRALYRVFWQQNWSTTDKSCPHNPFLRVSTAACWEKQHCGASLKNLHQKPWDREGSSGIRFPEASSPTTAPSSSEFNFLTHKKLFVHVRKRSAHSPAPKCLLE